MVRFDVLRTQERVVGPRAASDEVVAKAIADAHTTAITEAMEYLAPHAGYTRVHNPITG